MRNIIIFIVLLYITSFISINYDNYLESAVYLKVNEFKNKGDMLHYTADMYTVNISYYYNNHDLNSLMMCRYYIDFAFNNGLFKAIYNRLDANTSYSRYWHGDVFFVKSLLSVINISLVYKLNCIIMYFLIVFLILSLYQYNKKFALFYSIGFLLVRINVVPHCLEYSWTFYIGIISCLLILKNKVKDNALFLFNIGMICAYIDFFSTETVTLTLPLILMMHKDKLGIKDTLKLCLYWSCGYSLCFMTKWLLTFKDISDTLRHIKMRIYDDANIMNALIFNICRLGISNRSISICIIIFYALAILAIAYIMIRNRKNYSILYPYIIIFLIPYLRYTIIFNHSMTHCFMTYRAQVSSIIVLCLIIYEIYFKQKIRYYNTRWKFINKRYHKREKYNYIKT